MKYIEKFVAHVSKIFEIKKKKKRFKFFIGLKHFQLCLAPLETPHRGTSLK